MWCMPGSKPAGGLVIPPVHAGIEPSALPAFSAPIGVKSVPNLATCSAVISARANGAAIIVIIVAAIMLGFLNI